jgi:hypothetical protein
MYKRKKQQPETRMIATTEEIGPFGSVELLQGNKTKTDCERTDQRRRLRLISHH